MIVAIRVIHTAIYMIMVAAIAYILYAGIYGHYVPQVLFFAIGMVLLECCVFVGSGWKCPLTTAAVSLVGHERKDYAPFVPEKLGRYTPAIFGSLFALGLLLLLLRHLFKV